MERYVNGRLVSEGEWYPYKWDDLRFPATRLRRGALQKPDFDFDNIGLLFPQNDPSEIVYINTQLPHKYAFGTDLHPHIHFVQVSSDLPVFKIDYRWYENGGDPSVDFTTIESDGAAFDYTSGSMLQVCSFPMIDGANINSLSSMLDIKLYRDDNVVTGDVLVKEFDIHWQSDAAGSTREYAK